MILYKRLRSRKKKPATATTSGLPGCSCSAASVVVSLPQCTAATHVHFRAKTGSEMSVMYLVKRFQAGTAPTSGLPGCSCSAASVVAPSANAAAAVYSSYVSECAVLCRCREISHYGALRKQLKGRSNPPVLQLTSASLAVLYTGTDRKRSEEPAAFRTFIIDSSHTSMSAVLHKHCCS